MPSFNRSPLAIGAYGLAAVLAMLELGILWQTLHPDVTPQYRAYYIDRSTTCLPQTVTGLYTVGTRMDFTSTGNVEAARETLPCGWENPNSDGRQSLGETSRLRFAVGQPQDLTLTLELKGVDLNDAGDRIVDVLAGDEVIGQATVKPEETATYEFAVPASAVKDGFIDLKLDFPNAIIVSPGMSNTYWRSVKLIAATLSPR